MTRFLVASVILAISLASHPARGAKANGFSTIRRIQLDSEGGRQDIVWLRLNITWTGTTCLPEWAYFDAEKSPHMLQLILAKNGSTLEVYVDDTLPMIDGYCRITNISVN